MTVGNENWLLPDWPAPARVRACVTTRQGGVSAAPFDSFNLGDHVGDDPAAVACNRQHLRDVLGCQPIWLEQVHSCVAVKALPGVCATADASWSETPGEACAVLTADCLPVLFCDRAGSVVAAAHAGWRGLAGGVLESTVAAMRTAPGDILAWMGPAIGPHAFEVGDDVREIFVASHPEAAAAFAPHAPGKWLADIYRLARIRLQHAGVQDVYGGGRCTFGEADRFYSYRRDGVTGRMASLIWRS